MWDGLVFEQIWYVEPLQIETRLYFKACRQDTSSWIFTVAGGKGDVLQARSWTILDLHVYHMMTLWNANYMQIYVEQLLTKGHAARIVEDAQAYAWRHPTMQQFPFPWPEDVSALRNSHQRQKHTMATRNVTVHQERVPTRMDFAHQVGEIHCFNSYSASYDNWCTATLWNRIMTAQCEGMGEVGSARYEPALLPPCPSIRALSYSNCQRSTHSNIRAWQFKC